MLRYIEVRAAEENCSIFVVAATKIKYIFKLYFLKVLIILSYKGVM